MMFPILYGKNSDGSLNQWHVMTAEEEISVTFGKVGGKIQEKITKCIGKNIGKANETSPAKQAELEAEAKWVKQQKRGYFKTQEEALAFEEFSPMKCHNYNDFAHKIVYPCFMQAKLDGFRCMVDNFGQAYSKAGELYTLPEHIQKEVEIIQSRFDVCTHPLDGEIYAGLGVLSLQQISSAFRKKNENTEKLKYFIYNIPRPEWGMKETAEVLEELGVFIYQLGLTSVQVVYTSPIFTEEEGNSFYDNLVNLKYEGAVYHNASGGYEFGKRSYNMQKRKPRQSAEARVLSITKDKNSQGVLTVEGVNGEQKGSVFDLLMRKDSDEFINYRLYDNALSLLNKTIEYQYEDLSDKNIPLKPCGVRLRSVSINTITGKWEVME